MCVAAISKKGGFSKDQLNGFFRTNGDGGSFMYAEKGKLMVIRHMLSLDDYVTTGLALANKDNLVTHCRVRTQGLLDQANSHPFMLNNDKAGLVHNGNIFTSNSNVESDTLQFAKAAEVLGDVSLMTRDVVDKVSNIIGQFNKLIVLYDNADFRIFNEIQGYWSLDENIWTSNNYYFGSPTEVQVKRARLTQPLRI